MSGTAVIHAVIYAFSIIRGRRKIRLAPHVCVKRLPSKMQPSWGGLDFPSRLPAEGRSELGNEKHYGVANVSAVK